MMKTLFSAGVSLLALGLAATPASAGAIYDNISAASGATSGGTAAIAPGASGPLADSFTTGGMATTLSDVMLLISALTPSDGGSFSVLLLSDSGTAPGGTIATIASIDDSSLTSSLSTYTETPASTITLAANTRYWVELSETSSTSGRWSFDSTNVGTGVAGEYNYFSGSVSANSNFTPYQMEVDVASTAVPEPASLMLLASSMIAFGLIRRRRG